MSSGRGDLDFERAFVHSLPKSGGGAWPTCPPGSTPFAANELSSEWMQLHPVGCHNECEIVLKRTV